MRNVINIILTTGATSGKLGAYKLNKISKLELGMKPTGDAKAKPTASWQGFAVVWRVCGMGESLQKVLAKAIRLAVYIGVLVAALAWSSSAMAQRKVIRLEAIKVEGRIQKPQAFYILQRSNLNFEGLDLKQSFIPKIIKSVDDKPF